MPATEAQIAANRKNAAKSTGPKTEEGKAKSRRNSLKHGLTGAGVIMREADEVEVANRTTLFAQEFHAVGASGQVLARRAALHSVRMDRATDQQAAVQVARLNQVEADFVPPDGVDDETADGLLVEAVRMAMIDTSKEATLIRQYEVEAERGFLKAIKELRTMAKHAEAQLKAADKVRVDATVGSILAKLRADRAMDDEMDALFPELAVTMPPRPAKSPQFTQSHEPVDVPITIGRGR